MSNTVTSNATIELTQEPKEDRRSGACAACGQKGPLEFTILIRFVDGGWTEYGLCKSHGRILFQNRGGKLNE